MRREIRRYATATRKFPCAYRGCSNPVAFEVSSWSRLAHPPRLRRLCEMHGTEFIEKYGLTVEADVKTIRTAKRIPHVFDFREGLGGTSLASRRAASKDKETPHEA